MEKQIVKILLALFCGALLTTQALAEDAVPEKKEKKLPQSGSLSSSISGVHDSRAVPGPWGGVDVRGESASPITGSVSKLSARNWQMRVFNNSEEAYTVNLVVNQFNRNNTKIKSDSFSYTLKAGGRAERMISSLADTEQCTLDLVSWKKLSK